MDLHVNCRIHGGFTGRSASEVSGSIMRADNHAGKHAVIEAEGGDESDDDLDENDDLLRHRENLMPLNTEELFCGPIGNKVTF